jgi:phosphoglycolate phosphatase
MTGTVSTDYEAIVFDNDGVIVEPTDRAHLTDAVCEAFSEFGHEPDRDAVYRTVADSAGPAATVDAVGIADSIDVERFWTRREACAAATQKQLVRDDGKCLYDDVAALETLEARIGMVSNNQHETVSFIVDHHGLDFFETVHGRDPSVAGAERKKPDPYYLERALSELGTREALYVGDSEVDIEAARRAGVDSAFLRREHTADTDLAVEPTYEVPDLRRLAELVS